MRGRNDATSRSFEISLAYIHGRIEQQLISFADKLAVNPMELTTRLGALLLGAGERPVDYLPRLPLEAGTGRGPSPEMEGSIEPHGRSASHGPSQEAVDHAGHPEALTKGSYWDKLTPIERSQKMLDRYLAIKHKTPQQKKAIATLRRKLADKESIISKQAIYSQRARAKAAGLPLPPLPQETDGETKKERINRLQRERRRKLGAKAAKRGWAGMTKAERSAEMKRRMTLGKQNSGKKSGRKPAPTYVNAGAHSEVRQASQEAASA